MTKKANEIALEILEEHYKAATKQTDAWNFFLNTAEYAKFALSNEQVKRIVNVLEEQQKWAYEAFKKIDLKAVRELQNVSADVIRSIEKAKINLEPVVKAIRELQEYNLGHILSSMPKAHFIENGLFDIAVILSKNGYINIIQKYIDNEKEIKNIYGNLNFSKTLPIRNQAEEELDMQRKTQVWGAWQEFPFLSRIFFDDINLDEEIKDLAHRDKMKRWEMINYFGVKTEFGRMRSGEKKEDDLVFFKVSEFRNKLDRIHKYIKTELLLNDGTPQEVRFDDKKSILFFEGKEITIAKRNENDAHDLLRAIFKDKTKTWNNDEILSEMIGLAPDVPIPKNKVYQAGNAVNRLIAQETTTKDFLVVTTKTVAINSKYLP